MGGGLLTQHRQRIKRVLRRLLLQLLPRGFFTGIGEVERRTVRQMMEKGFNCPKTSSMGRLFDAVAAICGVRERVSFEGQAAMMLEWAAEKLVNHRVTENTEDPQRRQYAFEIEMEGDGMVIDTRPLIREVVEDVGRGAGAGVIGRRFHSTVVEMIVEVCGRVRARSGIDAPSPVVLSGGVFMNALLLGEATGRLKEAGFRVYRHRVVPANDGGIALGQIAVAARRLGRVP